MQDEMRAEKPFYDFLSGLFIDDLGFVFTHKKCQI